MSVLIDIINNPPKSYGMVDSDELTKLILENYSQPSYNDYHWVELLANTCDVAFKNVMNTFPHWKQFESPILRISTLRLRVDNIILGNVVRSFEFIINSKRSNMYLKQIALLLTIFCSNREMLDLTINRGISTNLAPPKTFQAEDLLISASQGYQTERILAYLRRRNLLQELVRTGISKFLVDGQEQQQLSFFYSLLETPFNLRDILDLPHIYGRLRHYDAIIKSGRLGKCAGRHSGILIIETIWQDCKDSYLLYFNHLTEFFGYRIDPPMTIPEGTDNDFSCLYYEDNFKSIIRKFFTHPEWHKSEYYIRSDDAIIEIILFLTAMGCLFDIRFQIVKHLL